jgi:hypothetical protein
VRLETAGLPTAMILTSAFVREASVQKEALGMADLDAAVIDHPLSTLSAAEIEERARQAAPQCVAIWLGRPSPA